MTILLQNIDQEEAWGASLPLDLGWNNVTVTKVEEGVTPNGNPAFRVYVENEWGGAGREQIVVMAPSSDSKGTLGKVRNVIEACGLQVQGGDWQFDPTVLTGKKCSVLVVEEPGRDDPSKTFRVIKGFDAFGAHGAGGSGNGAPAGDTSGFSQPVSSSTQDDDIPF